MYIKKYLMYIVYVPVAVPGVERLVDVPVLRAPARHLLHVTLKKYKPINSRDEMIVQNCTYT